MNPLRQRPDPAIPSVSTPTVKKRKSRRFDSMISFICCLATTWSYPLGIFSSLRSISANPISFRIFPCIVDKVFRKRHQRVRMTAVLYLTALAQAHEAVARSPFAVTGGAEGWNASELHQPPHHFHRAYAGPIRQTVLNHAAFFPA